MARHIQHGAVSLFSHQDLHLQGDYLECMFPQQHRSYGSNMAIMTGQVQGSVPSSRGNVWVCTNTNEGSDSTCASGGCCQVEGGVACRGGLTLTHKHIRLTLIVS